MNEIISKTVASALDEMEIHYKKEGQIFIFSVGDDCADFPIRIIADEENELLTTVGYFPVKVPKMNLEKMYKFINEVNYKTMVGLFVIDSEDGELTFRLANNVDGGVINESIVKACFLQVMCRLSNTFEDIMKSIYGCEQFTLSIGNGNRPCA